MCKAKEIASNVLELLHTIDNEFKSLNEQLSEIDLTEQDLLHRVEQFNFNACEGFYLAKALQEIRQQRRTIKNEWHTMKSLKNFLDNHKNWKNEWHGALRNINNLESTISDREYKPRILKPKPTQTNNPTINDSSSIKHLQKVNKVPGLKFKKNKKQERLFDLLNKVTKGEVI